MMWCSIGILITLALVTAAPSGNYCGSECEAGGEPVCDFRGNKWPNACMRDSCGASPRLEMCLTIYDPVCGTNGKTYGSMCTLQQDACLGVEKAHDGPCTAEGQQKRHEVSRCDIVCTYEYNPVCGSDGVKYDNPCQLERQACLSDWTVSIPVCTMEYRPVCGSDDVTYGNDCALRAQSCFGVSKKSDGECEGSDEMSSGDADECEMLECRDDGLPVCDADGNRYDSFCDLERARCRSDNTIFMGMCTMEFWPVCGSDGRIYGNKCQLNSQSCLGVTEDESWAMCGGKKNHVRSLLKKLVQEN